MARIPGHPLSALVGLHKAAAQASLHDADVIIGRDVETDREFVVYGRDTLQSVASGDDEAAGYNIVCIELYLYSQEDELEQLLEVVRSVKGRDEYKGVP